MPGLVTIALPREALREVLKAAGAPTPLSDREIAEDSPIVVLQAIAEFVARHQQAPPEPEKPKGK
jgi:hypothetical protein